MPNTHYEWGGGQPPLKRVQDHFFVSKCRLPPIPAMRSQVLAWLSVSLGEGRQTQFPQRENPNHRNE